MLTILTRRQAAEAGLKRYYTGKPCAKNHDSERFTSTGGCVKCGAEYVKSYNKRMTATASSRALGAFMYMLHPDDHAAALAYCQALDLARGVAPKSAAASGPAVGFNASAARAKAFGLDVDHVPQETRQGLDPAMAAQLRAAGVLK